MQICPRCHTSMIWSTGDAEAGYPAIWRCLGCGLEMLAQAGEAFQDGRLREQPEVAPHFEQERHS